MFSKQTSFLKSVNKSPPLSSKFRINASGHLIPLLTKKWRVKLSSESVRHVQLLFLWDSRVASDTLNVFVSWQLHNISWQQVVVSRFYIIYCQSKTMHRRFSFPRVAFCLDLVGLYWKRSIFFNGNALVRLDRLRLKSPETLSAYSTGRYGSALKLPCSELTVANNLWQLLF